MLPADEGLDALRKRDYAAADGALGYFQHSFRVYDREGEACLRCGQPVRRIVQAGRWALLDVTTLPGTNFVLRKSVLDDVGGWDNCRWIVFHGSSGHPASPWYINQNEKWAKGELVPMLYDWATIKTSATAHQELRPVRY